MNSAKDIVDDLEKRKKIIGAIIVMEKECCLCGEKFAVEIERRTGKILTKCFYGGKIRLGVGTWCAYKWDGSKPDGTPNLVKIHPWYRELWYHLIDYKRLLFHQYKDVEYWEGPCCYKKRKNKD